ncbi:MAG: hypothetical protein CM15mV54_810 [Caudoviricetes sp.]|nr:MAG: hypothetical protein CM15mV54_810 [Caudoviricetes sp.]
MLFYQDEPYVPEKGAVKHDDRLDVLAMGVKYYTDALAISAYEQVKLREREEFQDILDTWKDDLNQQLTTWS